MKEQRRPARGPRRGAPAPRAAAPPASAVPLIHPAMLFVLLVTAVIVCLSVTFEILDPDQWQHLTVGRFIWEQHRFPTTQLWTWPTYGAKDVDYAWGFEALVWPLWKLGGLLGLYLWRWLTTLAAFAFAWVAARRMGAKGFVPLVVVALCAMMYRTRAWVRPESVAAVLLAAELWLLEARRHGARVNPAWLLLIAWVWANTHISYYLFFLVLGIHVVAAHLPPRREGAPPVRVLWLTGLAAAAISFVNPSGWRTLWQPFEFWLVWRHEPIYKGIGELLPTAFSQHVRDGLLVVLVLWPLLALLRARRHGLDRVEIMMCLAFSALVRVERFVSVYALVAAVYVARDLDEWARAARLPGWGRSAWARGALAVAACVLVALPDLQRPDLLIRMRLNTEQAPIGASEFIEKHDLHGRMFNQFDYGGYLCFRFWPRRDRLPFMGIHQEGSRELRADYVAAQDDPRRWPAFDRRYRFDYLVIGRLAASGWPLLSRLDRDTTWARVFGDDVAYLFVRRHGPYARLAADSAYTVLPSNPDALAALCNQASSDSSVSPRVERELWREVAGSRYHAQALGVLATGAANAGRIEEAQRDYEEVLQIAPATAGTREILGMIALSQGRPDEALRWFEAERRARGDRKGLDLRRGQVAEARGDLERARSLYAKELGRDPGNQEARSALQSVARKLGR